jgi:D-sedoheptulose 7-phosphate isomerase
MEKQVQHRVNNLERFYGEDSSIKGFAAAYLAYIGKVISNISLDEIESFVEILLAAREKRSTVYFIGNGGSASTASHFANDLAIGTKVQHKPFRAVSLCDNQSIIMAIGNDYGYDQVFSRQLEILLRKDDVVVAISASGNSPNLLTALKTAQKKGAITVGLTSFDGGRLREIADISVHVPAEKGEYGPAEDGHMVLDHLIGNYLMRYLEK